MLYGTKNSVNIVITKTLRFNIEESIFKNEKKGRR